MVAHTKRRKKTSLFGALVKSKNRIGNRINETIAMIPYGPLMVTTVGALILRLSFFFSFFDIFLLTAMILLTIAVYIKTEKKIDDGLKKIVTKCGVYPVLILTIVGALLLELSITPAEALFFQRAEQWAKDEAFGENVSPEVKTTISLVFNVLRFMFLVYIAIAIVKVINAAREDEDWKALAKQPAIILLAVLLGDSLSTLVIGGTPPTGGGGGTPVE